jgi:hypothetical protein
MTEFTIFRNSETGDYAAVYDFQLPTPTGIGCYEKWIAVYHGQASSFLDRRRQLKEFEKLQNNC